MNDTISRHGTSAWLENMGYPNLAKMIMDEKRFPSAQPEIIRCKDCKYGMVDDPEIPFLRFCEYNGQDWNDENHYCGYAKRREVTDGRD